MQTAMASKVESILEELKGLTLLEASDLVKKMEEAFGVSAAAAGPVVVAGGGAGGGAAGAAGGEGGFFVVFSGGGGSGRREDGIFRRSHGSRREQDQRDQGGPRGHQPGLEGSQGFGGRRAQDGERGREQGRGGNDQKEVRRRRSQGRYQVAAACKRPECRAAKELAYARAPLYF